MRRLPPAMRADLDALDAALAGGGADATLAVLVDGVRASAPAMDPAFAARLEAQVADGFGRSEPARAGRRRRLRPVRRLVLAGAAGVLAAVAIAVAVQSGGGQRAATELAPLPQSAAGRGGASTAAPATGEPGVSRQPSTAGAQAAQSAPAVPAGPAAASAAPAGARQQQLSASLSLTTTGSVQGVADGVARLAGVYGGYVQSSQVSDGAAQGQATLDLFVASDRLSAALADISSLAHLQSSSQSALDITSTYNGAKRDLADAVAQRQALLRALARATTQGEIDSYRAQLQLIGARIDQARARFDGISRQARLAEVSVTVTASRPAAGAWSLGGAFTDAGHVLSAVTGAVVVGAAGLLPLLGLLGAGALGLRSLRRARRERALNAPL